MTVSVADPRLSRTDSRTRWRVRDAVARHPEAVTAVLCAAVLVSGLRGPDLPAQNYRVWLLRHHGPVVFDAHWYAGHALPGYSLLFPPLAALTGARLLGAFACVASTAAFARLLRGRSAGGHTLALLWFAVVVVVDLVVGRLPFALGLAAGVGALAAAKERRTWWAAALSVTCGAASPLAGAFLLLAAVAWLPSVGVRRSAPLLGPVVGIAAAVFFGEGGRFPFPAVTIVTILVFCGLGVILAPRDNPVLRRGLVVYAVSSLALFVVPNAIGGNMIRLGAVFAGPLAALELERLGRRRVLALLAGPLLFWQLAPVPSALANGHGDPSANSAYYAGLVDYLDAHDGQAGRVEVPLTRGRWEADYLATHVALARGWERQLDLRDNAVLYDRHLTPAAYKKWLDDNGVRWVALPDVPLDRSVVGENQLLHGPPLPFLRPVWHDAHWQLWRVIGGAGVAMGPVRVLELGVSRVRLDATSTGTAVVLVRWSRFWRVTEGDACIGPTTDGWTRVTLLRPGPVTLTAKASVGALAGGGSAGSCSHAFG